VFFAPVHLKIEIVEKTRLTSEPPTTPLLSWSWSWFLEGATLPLFATLDSLLSAMDGDVRWCLLAATSVASLLPWAG
jgi:hypothetical protein